MYLSQTIRTKALMQGDGMFTPIFKSDNINNADRLEIWSSSFKDDGSDYNIFKLMQAEKVLEEHRIEGY